MKNLRYFLKNIIIFIVIFVLIFSTITPVSLAYTPEEVGNAVAGFAKHVVDTYGQEGKNIVGYRQVVGDQYDNSGKGGVPGHCRTDNPIWSPSSYTWNSEYIYFDCSSFATGCYHYVAGVIDSPHATGSLMGSPSDMSGKFEKIHWDKSQSSLKNGDLMFYDGHAWIYSGDGKTSENGRYHCNWDYHNGQDIYIYRITSAGASAITTLNTEFSVAGTSNNGSGIAAEKINYSNFFFNGIPDGKYSLASRESIFTIIINSLKELVNYFTGLITYLLRGFIIGIISVFDRLINNTIESVSNSPKTLKETGVKATNADDPISMDRSVTIEGLIFGEVDLFDINIFKVD